uniref:Uncharacterized protein MANES_13G100500 n=1 Tax=Rhizophora mucronata TaxID=61149 RepID=A0A2P2PL75_RHIMU
MAATTDVALQLAILLLAIVIFAIQYKHFQPKRTTTSARLRTKNRRTASLQTNRHLTQATHFVSRAKATSDVSQSQSLAKNALLEVETAISLAPRDPAPLILKALALDLLRRKSSALRSLDLALSAPRVKLPPGTERGDALFKRAELKLEVNSRRRVDSAIEDLEEAVKVKLSGGNDKALCLLGRCYELKGMKDRVEWAFDEASRVHMGP